MNRDSSTTTLADIDNDNEYRLDVRCQISTSPDMDGPVTKKSMAEWRSERQRTIEPRYPNRWFGSKRVTSAMFAGCNLLTMVDSLFGFYLLDHMVYQAHLTGTTSGNILLASELFNVPIGLLASYLMEILPFRSIGTHRLWILLTVFPLAISFTLMWYIPPLSTTSLIIYFIFILFMFNLCYGTLLIAYEGAIPLMASREEKLAKINSRRMFVGSCGNVLASLGAAGMVPVIRDAGKRALVLGGSVAGVVLVFYVGWVFLVREHPPPTNGVQKLDGRQSELEKTVPDSASLDITPRTSISDLSTITKSSSSTTLVDSSSPPSGPQSKGWWPGTRQLFTHRPAYILVISHFLLWAILVHTHSALPAYVRDYLQYETSLSFLDAPTAVIAVLQIGTAVAQICVSLFPAQFPPERVLKVSLGLMVIAKLAFALGFETLHTVQFPPVTIFVVAAIDGIAQGGLFAAYELLVPEVILYDEHISGWAKENIIYGWVDSIRELSLAFSFLSVGSILDKVDVGLASRLCCGWIPLGIVGVCVGVFAFFPYITLTRYAEKREEEKSRVEVIVV